MWGVIVSARQVARARVVASEFCTAEVTVTRGGDPVFANGKITPGAGTVVYAGVASISDRRDSRPAEWGGLQLAAGQWLMRAPLNAHAVERGDLVHVDVPGDYPGVQRDLWVHEVLGRQIGVLARVIVSTTEPGDVDA